MLFFKVNLLSRIFIMSERIRSPQLQFGSTNSANNTRMTSTWLCDTTRFVHAKPKSRMTSEHMPPRSRICWRKLDGADNDMLERYGLEKLQQQIESQAEGETRPKWIGVPH